MTIIDPPRHWREVEESDFVEFLASCPDYQRTGYVGAVRYWFKHNEQRFAVVVQEDGKEHVYVDPTLLM